MRDKSILCVMISMLLLACSQDPPVSSSSTDWILINGRIYTVNEEQPWAEAVVIRDSEFVYVGSNAGAKEFVTEGTRTSDLGGRMVIPGLADAHTHPGQINLMLNDADFTATERNAFLEELEQ